MALGALKERSSADLEQTISSILYWSERCPHAGSSECALANSTASPQRKIVEIECPFASSVEHWVSKL